jgi:hypothetical protein
VHFHAALAQELPDLRGGRVLDREPALVAPDGDRDRFLAGHAGLGLDAARERRVVHEVVAKSFADARMLIDVLACGVGRGRTDARDLAHAGCTRRSDLTSIASG